ncbi:hypothetical protein AURDEDRAFT_186562 [Auricularia subglabra TFB-10046 SS5]|uniref:Endo-chitosanase n=1 Tax=Auricularia subglabra (strain TFB-10046 / SS5) TaxID=717982 RepID=J0LKA9_AURST|nr:hypothetical protein AURDEDRAFT_186562 [Auricularia subglabra TFB-10046 SS5]
MPSTFSVTIYLSLVASAYAAANFTRRADGSAYQADASIDVDAIYKAVQASVAAKNKVLATYPTCNDCDSSSSVDIVGEWSDLVDGTFSFMADMDVDCDGVAWQCPGNPDGQAQTSFGAMDATQAPWYVIPEEFYQQGYLQPNALGAVICNGRMFYGVFADSNGNTPQIIGEASLILAQTCFPDDGMAGDVGHGAVDVAYIVFGNDVPDGVGEQTLDYGSLKALGDQKMKELAQALSIGGGPSGGGEAPQEPEQPEPAPEEPEEPEEPAPEPEEPAPEPEEPAPEPEEPAPEPEQPEVPEPPAPSQCARKRSERVSHKRSRSRSQQRNARRHK